MPFQFLDYVVIAGYVVLMIAVAWMAKKRGQNSLDDFFAGGKNLPWWLVGVSMVATTFAADTPLAITGLVANQGIAGNWFWLSWMFSGVITVFIYAKLWKRADVLTDCEFIELRYGGKPASFLRGFRALYFAFPFNCIIMGWVTVGMAWWAAWYPGAEPGGGGYIAQRMFSAKDERNAVGATLLHNILMYAVRPWPWILVALVSIVVFPDLVDKEAGYPMMMSEVLPVGWFGLMTVAFLAAFVSTISTQLNWGTSYLINDFYARFIKKEDEFESNDKAQKHYVFVSRIATIAMAGLAIIVSYFFDSVKGGWEFILSLSAGIGGVMMLRWFWWRINAWSEIVAMIMAFSGAIFSKYMGFDFATGMIFTTAFSTCAWVLTVFITKPESRETLEKFYAQVHPMGKGWVQFSDGKVSQDRFFPAAIKVIVALAIILSFLYGMKDVFFGDMITGLSFMLGGSIGIWVLVRKI